MYLCTCRSMLAEILKIRGFRKQEKHASEYVVRGAIQTVGATAILGFDFWDTLYSLLIINFVAVATIGKSVVMVLETDNVDGGICSSGSLGMLRRCCAHRICPFLTFQAEAASLRPASERVHHWRGWTSSARFVPRRMLTSSPIHQALPLGGGGLTRSKHVSPVQVSVLPLPRCYKDFAPEGLPLHASSTIAISGHCSPENKGFVVLRTSMFLASIGGGSSGRSKGEKRVVRGSMCTRTR